MLSIFKALLILTTINVSAWQNSLYDELTKRLSYQAFPTTILSKVDDHSVTFLSFAAVKDPGDKYYYVMHDTTALPTWLFLMRHDHRIKDELWHRGVHLGVPCNVMRDEKLLFHLKTVGFIKTNILFQVKYFVQNTKYGVVLSAEMDKDFPSEDVLQFRMFLWTFPHPTIKNLVIVVSQGYIRTDMSIDMLNNHIKWHVDNVLQNFGDRLTAVAK
jgi:hypothetical protein